MHTYTIHGTAYAAAELREECPRGFDNALQSWQADNLDYEWWECTYDDFTTIAEMLGFDLDPKRIYFQGFCSGNDGACFQGSYSYRKGAAKAIREYAPQDSELHKITDALQAAQRPWFYQLTAEIRSDSRNYTVHADVEHAEHGSYIDLGDQAEAIDEAISDLAHWLYVRLREEAEYLNSEESFIDSAEANEWFFDEDGEMVDAADVDEDEDEDEDEDVRQVA